LKDKDYSIVGISNLYDVETIYFKEIVQFLKKEKNCIIISGGQNATYNANEFLEEGLCDFVCERESENKIRYLFDKLFELNNVEDISGIRFKYDGKIFRTNGKDEVIKPDWNIIKAHEKLPIEDYCRVGSLNPFSRMVGKDVPYIGILMNRGCRGCCKFCSVRDYMGVGIRGREVNEVFEEIKYLYDKRGIRYFEILDDDFTASRLKTLELLQKIMDSNMQIKWAANNGLIANSLDEEILIKMRDSGCVGFKIGIESGNEEILRQVNKPGTLESFRKFSKRIQNFPEIFVIDDYIFGFPEENFEKMFESYKFSIDMNLDWSSLTIYQYNTDNSKDIKKGDFVPTKDFEGGKIKSLNEIFRGLDVFKIPLEIIPSREQLNEIWFTFNLVRNFIDNKHLKDNGNPRKFIRWVETLEERYPTHPYINLFLSLANGIIGDSEKMRYQHNKTIKNLESEYWMNKLKPFGFLDVLDNFPKTIEEAKETLKFLRMKNAR